MVAAAIGDIVYGLRIEDVKHSYIAAGQQSIEGLDTARSLGVYWTEFLPVLKYIPAWMPGAAARKLGNFYKPIVAKMREEPFDAVIADVVSSHSFQCLTGLSSSIAVLACRPKDLWVTPWRIRWSDISTIRPRHRVLTSQTSGSHEMPRLSRISVCSPFELIGKSQLTLVA